MSIGPDDITNPEVLHLLNDGRPVQIEGVLTPVEPMADSTEFVLIINSFALKRDPFTPAEELVLTLERLDFKRAPQVYPAVIKAFFGDVEPSSDTNPLTLTLRDIFSVHFIGFGLGDQPLKTGLEKLTTAGLLLSEPVLQRRSGKRRYYTPNLDNFTVWQQLRERYVS